MSGQACAILVAAGSGSRFITPAGDASHQQPKQLQSLRGRPIYSWPLQVLLEHEQLRLVLVVTLPNLIETVQTEIAHIGARKSAYVTTGGATRQESVLSGLNFLCELHNAPDIVLIHDAARPFLTPALVDDVLAGARMHGAATAAVPVHDTVKTVTGGHVAQTLDRQSLVLVQTPQAARFDWLLAAHQSAMRQGFVATDDAAVLEESGHPVAVVPGSPFNIKITRLEDLTIAEALFGTIFSESS